jgi:hypothetical protein
MTNIVADAVERFDVMERERADDDVELVGRQIDVFDRASMILGSRVPWWLLEPFRAFSRIDRS